MHIPDGFLDVKTLAATAAASAVVLTLAVKKSREKLQEKQVPLMGVLAAFIFAAQMVNFPIIGGTSGHLIGAVLAAVILGPWSASLIMAVILLIQCFLFQDGGFTALGANILNMGAIAPFTGYYLYLFLKRLSGRSLAAFFSAWVSVLLAAAAAALEIALAGYISLKVVLPAMLFWHFFIGLGEGIITAVIIAYLARVRGEILEKSWEGEEKSA